MVKIYFYFFRSKIFFSLLNENGYGQLKLYPKISELRKLPRMPEWSIPQKRNHVFYCEISQLPILLQLVRGLSLLPKFTIQLLDRYNNNNIIYQYVNSETCCCLVQFYTLCQYSISIH